MKRVLLPFAMILSLWPVGLIAVSMATGSSSSDPAGVTVPIPPELSDPNAPAKTARVQLEVDGKTYSCPRGTAARLDPIDQQSGTIKLKLRAVRRDQEPLARRLDQLDKLYPGKSAPRAIADEYNGLLREVRRLAAREGRLVRQYNRTVDQHNEILDSDCY